jgi:PAS domain S-box-containing protein
MRTIRPLMPGRSGSARTERRSLSVGDYLAALALAVAIPLVALAFYVSQRVAESEREAARAGHMTTTRSLAGVVDREIEKHIAVGWTLAHSPALLAGDLAAFRSEAAQTHAYLPGSWIALFDLDQHMLVNTRLPLGTPLTGRPFRETEERALATGTPQVSDVVLGRVSRRFVAFVAVPVFQDGKPRYLLQLVLDPEHFRKLLREQEYPRDWLVGIVDRNGNFVARLPDEDGSRTGQPASEGWRDAIRHSPAGLAEHPSLEGDPIVEAYLPTVSGWTVGIAISKAAIEAPLRRTEWLLLAASLGCVALGLTLAWLIGRRFLRSTQVLHAAANDMAKEKSVAPAWTGVREIDGAVAAFAAASELLRARAEEREKFVALVEQSDDFIGMGGFDGKAIYVNRAGCRLVGLEPGKGAGLPIAAFHPEPWARKLSEEILPVIRDGEKNWVGEAQLRNMQTDRPIDVMMNIFGVRHPLTGEVLCYAGVMRDITEQKRAAALERTLMGELQHRSNNLLAVIQAVAQRSLRGDGSLDEARDAFQQRLLALARAHRELTKSNFAGLEVGEIVRAELAPFAARARIDGERVMLGPQEAQNFSLAVHELATNAAKYGALSGPEGFVDIRWTVAANGSGPVLQFAWQERDGPAVVTPARRGFGSWLLGSLFAQAQFDYAATGLRCTLDMPLGRSGAAAAPAPAETAAAAAPPAAPQ